MLVVLDETDPALLAATMAVVDEECGGLAPTCSRSNWSSAGSAIATMCPSWPAVAGGIVVDTVELGTLGRPATLFHEVIGALMSVEGTLVASAHQSHAYTDGACLYFTFAGRGPETGTTQPGARTTTARPGTR